MTAIRRKMIKAASELEVTHRKTSEQLDALLRCWLDKGRARGMYCPWQFGCSWHHPICRAMFPRIADNVAWPASNLPVCPCSDYSVEYVTKRAREALK